jgi:hypothetical protein
MASDLTKKQKRAEEIIDRELNPETYEHTSKTCSKCLKHKPLRLFRPLETHCIECKASTAHQRRLESPEKAAWMAARSRAKANNLPFTITVEDVKSVWKDTCPVLLIPLQTNTGNAKPNSPSLDRIINSKGYTPDNIAVVSNLFNSLKRDLTPEILRRMLDYMEGRMIP